MFINAGITIVDFSNESALRNWQITNDTVMGGVSNSAILWDSNGYGLFTGSVSTANNGGFSMVRLPVKIDLHRGLKAIKLKVKGDGKKYQFRLKSNNFQRHWFVHSFQTSGDWEEITLNLKDFYPSFRGFKLNIGNFSEESIREIALLIGNKVIEDFNLKIESISVVQ